MSALSMNILRGIAQTRDEPSISIYLPLHKPGTNTGEDRIKWSMLLKKAHEDLLARGFTENSATDLLRSLRELPEQDPFWQHAGHSIVALASPRMLRRFLVPLPLKECAMVGRYFHVRALFPYVEDNTEFYVLALSLDKVRLLSCTRYESREVELPKNIPTSLEEALKYDEFEQPRQLYTGTPGWGSGNAMRGAGRAGAVFYGHAVGSDVEKTNILRYVQAIAHGLNTVFREETAPLVLAGDCRLLSVYRQVNTYSALLQGAVEGSPDDKSIEELQRDAWRIVQPVSERAQHQEFARFLQAQGTGQTSSDVQEVILAAHRGQVATLFAAAGARQWGAFDPDNGSATLHADKEPLDDELLDVAVAGTLANGGTVYTLEPEKMPPGLSIAAILRY